MIRLKEKSQEDRVLGNPEDPVNILLVDDRPDGLMALEASIEDPQYNLVKAASGQEALACLYDRSFALVILDVQMPVMDGFETARLMKQFEPAKDTPIIFVTAINKDSRHIYEGYLAGAADYLFKPFDPLVLKSKVRIFVELYRKNRKIAEQAGLLLEAEKVERERRMAQMEVESLRRYQGLAESIPHVVWKSTPDGSVEYINEVWCNYTGLTREQSKGSGWRPAVDPADLSALDEAWATARRMGNPFEIEIRLRRGSDGAMRWHLVRVSDERDSDNRLCGWIGTATDIHDRNEAWERLSKTNVDLEQSNRDLEQFAYITSHDLQEPLRKILTFSDRLKARADALNDQDRDYLDRMHGAAHRMRTIIEDLLQHSKISRGEREYTDTNLREVLDEVLNDLELKVSQTGAMIEVGDMPTVRACRPQMRHLFQNLITNSIKFAKKGEAPHVHIESRRLGPTLNEIRVVDNGIGFDQKYVDRIFKPFQRLHARGEYEGTGIGLSIVQKIVDNHGGQITAVSQPGDGATFILTLPDDPTAS